ncbi:MAG TPA: beta-propeller fold lactonase family protein, partial [Terriglobales bacterium]|nr:beta-propeller fold lactonase family protein [Terriglobales bacterium]
MAATPAYLRSAAAFALALLVTTACAGQSTRGPLLLQITSSSGSTLPKGLTKQLQATRSFFRGTAPIGNVTQQVTWKSSTANAMVNSQGLVTGMQQGPATITATSGPLHANFAVMVVAPVVIKVTISPVNANIAVNSTQQFGAVTTLSDGTTGSAVSWNSSLQSVATIDPNNGMATGAAAGSTVITANSANSVSATAILNVGLNVITVTPVDPSIPLGTTQQFKAAGTFSGGGTSDVTNDVVWTSSSPLIATISGAGLASSVSTNSNPTTITATSGSVSGSTQLTVTPAALSQIIVTPVDPALLVGVVQPFTATGIYTDASKQDLTSLATWNSTTPAVAIVGMSTGVVTTVAVGKTTISATYNGITGNSVLSVRPGSRFAYIANQSDGTISIYALNENSGNLRDLGYSLNSSAQGMETVTTDVNGKFLYLANANSSSISGFAINNANGQLSPIPNSPFTAGLQPSSIVLDLSSKFAYVSNQGSNNISAFSVDAVGDLTQLTVPTYSTGAGSSPAEIVVHPAGFLYVADSGNNTISAFKINPDGSLAAVAGAPFGSGGNGPQAMVFDASGKYLLVLNKSSNAISVFTIDQVSGVLDLNPGTYSIGPNSLAMITDPAGPHLYVASAGSDAVYGFSVNSTTGALTPITGSPFAVPGSPQALAIDAAGFYLYAVNGNKNEAAIFSIRSDGALALVKSTRARSSPGAMIFSAGTAGQVLPAFAEVSTQDAVSGGGLLSYSVNAASGALTAADSITIGSQGANAVAADPSGRFIYTAQLPDGQVSGFTIDQFGVLTGMSNSPFAGGAAPFTLTVEPSGRFLYVAERMTTKNILGFQLNSSSGVLSTILGSP